MYNYYPDFHEPFRAQGTNIVRTIDQSKLRGGVGDLRGHYARTVGCREDEVLVDDRTAAGVAEVAFGVRFEDGYHVGEAAGFGHSPTDDSFADELLCVEVGVVGGEGPAEEDNNEEFQRVHLGLSTGNVSGRCFVNVDIVDVRIVS